MRCGDHSGSSSSSSSTNVAAHCFVQTHIHLAFGQSVCGFLLLFDASTNYIRSADAASRMRTRRAVSSVCESSVQCSKTSRLVRSLSSLANDSLFAPHRRNTESHVWRRELRYAQLSCFRVWSFNAIFIAVECDRWILFLLSRAWYSWSLIKLNNISRETLSALSSVRFHQKFRIRLVSSGRPPGRLVTTSIASEFCQLLSIHFKCFICC